MKLSWLPFPILLAACAQAVESLRKEKSTNHKASGGAVGEPRNMAPKIQEGPQVGSHLPPREPLAEGQRAMISAVERATHDRVIIYGRDLQCYPGGIAALMGEMKNRFPISFQRSQLIFTESRQRTDRRWSIVAYDNKSGVPKEIVAPASTPPQLPDSLCLAPFRTGEFSSRIIDHNLVLLSCGLQTFSPKNPCHHSKPPIEINLANPGGQDGLFSLTRIRAIEELPSRIADLIDEELKPLLQPFATAFLRAHPDYLTDYIPFEMSINTEGKTAWVKIGKDGTGQSPLEEELRGRLDQWLTALQFPRPIHPEGLLLRSSAYPAYPER